MPQNTAIDTNTIATTPISGNGNQRYNVGAHEHLGKVVITGSATPDCVASEDFVGLSSTPPSAFNPLHPQWIAYFNLVKGDSRETNQAWGSGYYVAYVRKCDKTGKYMIVAQAGPTQA